MEQDTEILPLKEFLDVTRRLERSCREWLAGTLDGAEFAKRFERDVCQNYIIAEIHSDDDAFDWTTIPAAVMDACNEAHHRHGSVLRLMQAVRGAVHDLEDEGHSDRDPLIRIIALGKYLERCGVEWRDFTNRRRSAVRAPEPRPPS